MPTSAWQEFPGAIRFGMPIITAQAEGGAHVTIDDARCDRCGQCVTVCHGAPLVQGERGIEVDQTRLFGCIACGQCMAVCPHEAIRVEGRDLLPADVFSLPPRSGRSDYGSLLGLLQARRSCRVFRPETISVDDAHRILDAARTAPMSVPPSGVGVLVLHGCAEVQAFRRALVGVIAQRGWLLRAPAVWLLRPFLSRAQWRFLRSFVEPTFDAYLGRRDDVPADRDGFFYGAPLAFYFYSSVTSEPADATIAATQAMLAAEALGYGTCFLGFPGYLLRMDGSVARRYGLPRGAQPGLVLVVGHPAVRPLHGIRRRFAQENWLFRRATEFERDGTAVV